MPQGLSVVVQAVAGRDVAWPACKASIEASDIGTDYEVMVNPPGVSCADHFLSVLRRLQEADTDLVVRLEDDAIVNRYLAENLVTWPAVHDPAFGCGWGFAPGGLGHRRRNYGKGRWYDRELHGSLVTLFQRRDLPWIVDGCAKWFDARKNSNSQDIALSWSVLCYGNKKINVHNPSLAEQPFVPSSLGHPLIPKFQTSRGTFDATWRRSVRQ